MAAMTRRVPGCGDDELRIVIAKTLPMKRKSGMAMENE
jgi:hypothetical protein